MWSKYKEENRYQCLLQNAKDNNQNMIKRLQNGNEQRKKAVAFRFASELVYSMMECRGNVILHIIQPDGAFVANARSRLKNQEKA